MGPKKKTSTLVEKLRIIQEVENNPGEKRIDIAKRLGMAPSTLNTIVSRKIDIRKTIEKCGKSAYKRKSGKESTFKELEDILHTWFQQARADNIHIDGTIIRQKALKIAEIKGITNFSASNGWINRFKDRYGLVYKKKAEVSESAVDLDTNMSWIARLPEIIKGYEPRDIYNADETGLFFTCFPDRTFTLSDQSLQEETEDHNSKERITVLLCTNSDGSDKLQPIVIGKSLKPRCFKDIKTLPLQYYANSKACITANIFTDFLRNLDSSVSDQGRKILLFVDNCVAHPRNTSFLKNIKVVTYPRNCSSALQPLDMGVIENFKELYRKQLVQKMVCMMNSGRDIDQATLQINVLQAINYTVSAWHQVKASTIRNCFWKCGYLSKAVTSKEEEVMETDDESNYLFDNNWRLVAQGDLDFATYMQCDSELTTCGVQSIESLCETTYGSSEEEEGEEDKKEPVPTFSEALLALEKVKSFLYSKEIDKSVVRKIYEFEATLCKFKSEKSIKHTWH